MKLYYHGFINSKYWEMNINLPMNLISFNIFCGTKQGRKRPLDTPKRMIEWREREGEREKERYKERYREGGRDKREREWKRESERERERERERRACVKKEEGRARFPIWEKNPLELSVDYQWELSLRIMSLNYDLVYQWHRKVEIYRDTGVWWNIKVWLLITIFATSFSFSLPS